MTIIILYILCGSIALIADRKTIATKQGFGALSYIVLMFFFWWVWLLAIVMFIGFSIICILIQGDLSKFLVNPTNYDYY